MPAALAQLGQGDFEALWALRPAHRHRIRQPGTGRRVVVPRDQQAFGRDYRFSGSVNAALPLPALLAPYLDWAQSAVDRRLDGVLLNWYDAARGDSIGPHRDSRTGLVPGAPIATLSLGAERSFRLRPWPAVRGGGFVDFPARHGALFLTPWETNLHTRHEVPHLARHSGRRISITLRAFT